MNSMLLIQPWAEKAIICMESRQEHVLCHTMQKFTSPVKSDPT